MKCLDDCHSYLLDTQMKTGAMEFPETLNDDKFRALLQPAIHFYEMREGGTKLDGVTNEEVLSVLIHRLTVLNSIAPCFENEMALASLGGALSWLNARTENRVKRGVEGTHKP
jgi:hypothetical protein